MLVLDLTVFVLVYLLIVFLGFLQKERGDKYTVMAVVLMIAQACNIVFYLCFEERFDVLALSLAGVIWVHHAVAHRNDSFQHEYTLCTFQLNDISNHETWIVACVVSAVTWFFASV